MGDGALVDSMPSFVSLISGPPTKRQRCLRFESLPDPAHSSQEYSSQSPSPSISQQESHSNAGLQSQSSLRASSVSQSDQGSGPCFTDIEANKGVAIKQEDPSQRQSTSVRSAGRQSTAACAALPALSAAMGSHAPSAARSAASQAAAAAAAVTPVTSRHMSSQSGAAQTRPC